MLGNHRSGGRVAADSEQRYVPNPTSSMMTITLQLKLYIVSLGIYGINIFIIFIFILWVLQFMIIYKDALLTELVSSTGIIIIYKHFSPQPRVVNFSSTTDTK